jgi:hypothetical protein
MLFSSPILSTDRSLVLDMVGEVLLEEVGIGREHLDDCLGEPLHVSLPDLGILTLQLLKHLKALRQLGEYINHRVGKVGVLRILLELET